MLGEQFPVDQLLHRYLPLRKAVFCAFLFDHRTQLLSWLGFDLVPGTRQFVPANLAALAQQVADPLDCCRPGSSADPNICPIIHAFWLQEVRTVRPGRHTDNDQVLARDSMRFNVVNYLRLTGIRYGRDNAIHVFKKFIWADSFDFMRFIVNTKDDFPAFCVSKSNRSFNVFHVICGNRNLKFKVIRLSGRNFSEQRIIIRLDFIL